MGYSIIEGRNAEILQSIIDGKPYENTNPYPSRIEQLLMELKEVIEQGGGTTVDQTYTPTSENAQSGTAVAEALETIPSVTVDQAFDPTSANAQSGIAVAQAFANRTVYTCDFSHSLTFHFISTTTDNSDELYIYTGGQPGTAVYTDLPAGYYLALLNNSIPIIVYVQQGSSRNYIPRFYSTTYCKFHPTSSTPSPTIRFTFDSNTKLFRLG